MAAIILFVLWAWALVDALLARNFRRGRRWMWLLVIVLAPLLGAMVYVIAGRDWGVRPADRRRHPSADPPLVPRGPDDDPEFLANL